MQEPVSKNMLVTLATLAALASGSLGCQGGSKLDFTHLGRATWQRPDDVIAALKIQPGQTVADLGAGDGYFVPYLATAVTGNGRVYAVDVEEEIVQGLREEFASSENVEPILGLYEDPQLPDGRLDVVILVNVFHHIENPKAYFASLQADLKSGGRVAVLEPNAELTGMLSLFLDDGHTNTITNVRAEMEAAGYSLVESHDILPIQIFEVFEPR